MAEQKFWRNLGGGFKLHDAATDSLQIASLGVGASAPATGIAVNVGAFGDSEGGAIYGTLGDAATTGTLLSVGATRSGAMGTDSMAAIMSTTFLGHASDPDSSTIIGHVLVGGSKGGGEATYVGLGFLRASADIDICIASSDQNLSLAAINSDALTNGPSVTLTAGNAVYEGNGFGGIVVLMGGLKDGSGIQGYVLCASQAADQRPLVLKGYSGQTANLLDCADSDGNALFSVDADGDLTWGVDTVTPQLSQAAKASGAGATLYIKAQNSGDGAAGGLQLMAGDGGTTGGHLLGYGGDAGGGSQGGNVDFTPGTGGSTSGPGGDHYIRSGAGGAPNGNAGNIYIQNGAKSGSGNEGTIALTSNSTVTLQSSTVYFRNTSASIGITVLPLIGGEVKLQFNGAATNASFEVQGKPTSGDAAPFYIVGSSASDEGNGGNIFLQTGAKNGGTKADGVLALKSGSSLFATVYLGASSTGYVQGYTDCPLTVRGGDSSSGKGQSARLLGGTGSSGQAGGDAIVEAGIPGGGGLEGSVICKSNSVECLPKGSRIIHPVSDVLIEDLTATSYAEKGQIIFVDPTDWPAGKRVVTFAVAMKAYSATADDAVWVELYDVSNGNAVAGSQVSSGSTSWDLVTATVTLPDVAYAYRIRAKLAGPSVTGAGSVGSCELRITYS